MGFKITDGVLITVFDDGDLFDVSALVATGPDVYMTKSTRYDTLRDSILSVHGWSQVLGIDNTSNGHDVVMSEGDNIVSANNLHGISVNNTNVGVQGAGGNILIDAAGAEYIHDTLIYLEAPAIDLRSTNTYGRLRVLDAASVLEYYGASAGGNITIEDPLTTIEHATEININSPIIKIIDGSTLTSTDGNQTFTLNNGSDQIEFNDLSGNGIIINSAGGGVAINTGVIIQSSLSIGGNGNTSYLAFGNATNGNQVTLIGGVVSASYDLTLPTAQGGAGTYLKNDGSGNLSWDAGVGGDAGTIIVTSGTSFTTPSGITSSTVFMIWLIGAGGGGGGSNTASGNGSGGGAGGGVFVKATGLTASTSYTCAIGTGGTGGTGAADGTNGGDTTLTIGGITYTASGGGKGIGAISSDGGAGGTGTNGDLNVTGQRGGDSPAASAASTDAAGGSSPWGWGLGGAQVRSATDGKTGSGYGAGGSGGKSTANKTGGNGTNGIIFCQYYN